MCEATTETTAQVHPLTLIHTHTGDLHAKIVVGRSLLVFGWYLALVRRYVKGSNESHASNSDPFVAEFLETEINAVIQLIYYPLKSNFEWLER